MKSPSREREREELGRCTWNVPHSPNCYMVGLVCEILDGLGILAACAVGSILLSFYFIQFLFLIGKKQSRERRKQEEVS